MKIRKPVFAGSWYPGTENECRRQIESFIKENRFDTSLSGHKPAGVVPHAGWSFSGDLAAAVFHALAGSDSGDAPDVVVVFGMHMHPGVRPVMMKEGAWATPLGELPAAADLGEKVAAAHRFDMETPDAFAPENTIELQMPLVKYFFDGARVLTIGAPAGPAAMGIAETVVSEARTLGLSLRIIGSTDLTHYGASFGFTPAGQGQKAYEWVRDVNDRKVIDTMLAMDPEGVIREALDNQNACCPGAAAAAITAARALGAKRSKLVGYSSSYEKNPGATFVGYGGILYAG